MKSIFSSLALVACFSFSAMAEDKPTVEPLFLKEEISVKSDSGVTTLLPGTQVTRCEQTKEGIKVKTAEGTTTVVKETQLTADPTEGQRLAQSDANAQVATQAQIAQALHEKKQAAARSAELLNQTAAASAASTTSSYNNTAAGSTQTLTRSEIKYKAEDAGVTVKPPKFTKKKK